MRVPIRLQQGKGEAIQCVFTEMFCSFVQCKLLSAGLTVSVCVVFQEHAFESSQKYKEGKYIIEVAHMIKDNGWD